MSFPALLLLAVGLAMDATAVACARGLAARRVRARDSLRVGLLFGGAQAVMPVLGCALGATFAARILGWGHWVTFVVLSGIGAKMLHEARKNVGGRAESTSEGTPDNVFGLQVLALLALATSVDALAAGVALALEDVAIVRASAVIGAVTAVLAFAGVHIGQRFGARLGKRLEVAGGIVLIGLGVKSLIDHFMAP